MKNSLNKQRLQIVLIVVVAVLTLGIGYAGITAINLVINGSGTASTNQNNFKVYFTTSNITTGTGTALIDENDATIAYFNITGLSKVGDTATATYTVLNNSNSVGADISLQLTNSNSEYFKITESIGDTQLQAGDTTTVDVRVEMIKTPIENDVTTTVTARLTASPVENAQAVGSDPAQDPSPFASDSWATIKTNVQAGTTSRYNVGDTKEVKINGVDYTVRLANKTTDTTICSDENYSQTACGFVVEFVDIVEQRAMNPDNNTNIGGWPATPMRTYANGAFLNSLPSDLQSAIATTRVISGVGCVSDGGYDGTNYYCNNPDNGGQNFRSDDKIYLLSGVEVHGADSLDTAANTTRQLDYYVGMPSEQRDCCGGCGQCMYSVFPTAVKQYNGSDNFWWLRGANSDCNDGFRPISSGGNLSYGNASDSDGGFAPAFRIG